jgi:hypothetical protein
MFHSVLHCQPLQKELIACTLNEASISRDKMNENRQMKKSFVKTPLIDGNSQISALKFRSIFHT